MKEKIYLLQNLLYCFEIAALVSGLIAWKYIRSRSLKAFVLYLLFIAIGEQTGSYLGRHGYKNLSASLYNYIIVPVEFFFGYWFIYRNLNRKKWNILFVLFVVLDISTRLGEFLMLRNERFFFSSLSYLVSCLFLLIFILVFLWQFIRSDRILNYSKDAVFWIVIAMLIYYLGTFPLYIFYNYLYKVNKSLFNVYWEIQMYLNMLMYLLFGAGLLWSNLRYKPLSL